MKEKLIAFARNKENEGRVQNIHLGVLMVIFIIIVIKNITTKYYSVDIPRAVSMGLLMFLLVEAFFRQAILALLRKNENQLKKNKILLLLFSDPEFVGLLAIIPLLASLTLLSNSINIFLGIAIAIAIFGLNIFISVKISKYFSGKLKE